MHHRTTHQAVPADHPSVLALIALAPAMTPDMASGLEASMGDAGIRGGGFGEDKTLLACWSDEDAGGMRQGNAVLRTSEGRIACCSWGIDDPSLGYMILGELDHMDGLVAGADAETRALLLAMSDAPRVG